MQLGMIAGYNRMQERAQRQENGKKPMPRISRKIAYNATFQRGEMAAARVLVVQRGKKE